MKQVDSTEPIDCITCKFHRERTEQHNYGSMFHPEYCTEKVYTCTEVLEGYEVIIPTPKYPPKDICPCYTIGLKWEYHDLCCFRPMVVRHEDTD